MKWTVVLILLLPRAFAIWFTLERQYYGWNFVYVDWWQGNYHEMVTVSWYFYEMLKAIEGLSWPIATGLIIKHRLWSRQLLMFTFCFVITKFLGWYGFVLDRNSSVFSKIIMYIAFAGPVAVLLWPQKRQAKIVRIS